MVLFRSVNIPTAVLAVPVVLQSKAFKPTAVLSAPVVLFCKALVPTAVLLLAVFLSKALSPIAVL